MGPPRVLSDSKQVMLHLRRNQRRLLIDSCFAILAGVSVLISFLLRFDFSPPASERQHMITGVWLAVACKFAVFRFTKKDQGWLRYFTLRDLWGLLQANVLGSIFFIYTALYCFRGFPRSMFGIDLIVCFLLTAVARSSMRIYREVISSALATAAGPDRKAILIYGAGRAGTTVLKEILDNPSLRSRVVGFLDDDPRKRHSRVLEVPVRGCGREAAAIVARERLRGRPIEEIVIAMPSATGSETKEAVANCRAAGIPCKIVPGVGELLAGRVITKQLREVSVLDLLGREPVRLDEAPIRASIHEKNVLVTGAGGSIGSELCRQVARFRPRRLVAFDQSESDMFRIEMELRETFPDLDFSPQIGDISDEARVFETIRTHAIDCIFHAAAYKHVPMMEAHVIEAAKNNVIGTFNLAEAARRNGVERFLMISSDKAVNPTNVMGLTKRISELIIGSYSQLEAGTRFVSVRFGNVLGSNGSVIPSFQKQIAAGGPVTVTHPDVTRYFMTIPEAVQLVLQASPMGKGSEIFELDMGQPIKIVELARNMIRLSGLEPDRDIEIRFTGLRPGEKLFEELVGANENLLPTKHEKIKVFCGPSISAAKAQQWIADLRELLRVRDEVGVLQHMIELAPEYVPLGRWSQRLKEAERGAALASAAAS
jgi:FlaA1/EpsC-like NDP-sugar epimerase